MLKREKKGGKGMEQKKLIPHGLEITDVDVNAISGCIHILRGRLKSFVKVA